MQLIKMKSQYLKAQGIGTYILTSILGHNGHKLTKFLVQVACHHISHIALNLKYKTLQLG